MILYLLTMVSKANIICTHTEISWLKKTINAPNVKWLLILRNIYMKHKLIDSFSQNSPIQIS